MTLSRLLSGLVRSNTTPGKPSLYGWQRCCATTTQPQEREEADKTIEHTQSGLGARLEFVVQELENLQKQKAEREATLEKLRDWRENKMKPWYRTRQKKEEEEEGGKSPKDGEDDDEMEGTDDDVRDKKKKEVNLDLMVATPATKNEIVHPWPEWLDLMELLAKGKYFDAKEFAEDAVIEQLGGNSRGRGRDDDEEKVYTDCMDDIDYFRNQRFVRRACVTFGNERFDILSNLPQKDIEMLVGFGCPTTQKKVTGSAKTLRAFVHLSEGDVCSACKLRDTCPGAYMVPEVPAQTLDIMRVLAVYGLDPLLDVAENKLHKKKAVKASIRNLLGQIVALSGTPIDPTLPRPIFEKPPPKPKIQPPARKKRVGHDDVEMKAGDWLCTMCSFMNFAKNGFCLQCQAQRPKRDLAAGEWECPKCNFPNYKRNQSCYKCDADRPRGQYDESNNSEQVRRESPTSQSSDPRIPKRERDRWSATKAWNDDFDDDESDGAEVATFEYAAADAAGDFFENDTPNRDSPPRISERDSFVSQRHKRGETPWDHQKSGFTVPDKEELGAFNDFGDFRGAERKYSRGERSSSTNTGSGKFTDNPGRHSDSTSSRHSPYSKRSAQMGGYSDEGEVRDSAVPDDGRNLGRFTERGDSSSRRQSRASTHHNSYEADVDEGSHFTMKENPRRDQVGSRGKEIFR